MDLLPKIPLYNIALSLNCNDLDNLIKTCKNLSSLKDPYLLFSLYKDKSIIIALKLKKYEWIHSLINYGVDIHYNNDLALIIAIKRNKLDIVNLLLNNGANINISNSLPLRIAIKNNYFNIILLLLNNGANIHIIDEYPLRKSIKKENCIIISTLLNLGANIHIYNDLPLKYAVINNYHNIIKLLLDNKANYNIFNNGNRSLDNKFIKCNYDTIKLLLDYGYRPNTLLIDFFASKRSDIFKLFLDYNIILINQDIYYALFSNIESTKIFLEYYKNNTITIPDKLLLLKNCS